MLAPLRSGHRVSLWFQVLLFFYRFLRNNVCTQFAVWRKHPMEEHEQGLEIFYNYAVTPWFRITGDLQWINPASADNDKAWLGGLRANITF